jgi:hypothetical protein
MSRLRERFQVIFSFPFLILLGGCAAKPECDSIETRSAVLNLVSGDHANPLIAYAARNSGNKDDTKKPASEENKSASSDKTLVPTQPKNGHDVHQQRQTDATM